MKFFNLRNSLFSAVLAAGSLFSASNIQAADRDGSLIISGAILGNGAFKDNSKNTRDDGINFGLAALAEANINGYLGIETGLMLINRRYVGKLSGIQISSEVLRLHVPVTAKFWATDYLAIGAGPYVSFKTGDKKTQVDTSGGTTLGSVNTSADKSVEYGAEAAVTLNFALYEKYGFFLEGRGLIPLNTEDNEDANEYLILAGIKLDL